MRPKARLDWRTTVRVALVGGWFDRRDELLECLRQGPESVLPANPATVTPPSRWQLATIGQAAPWLQTYTVSGVWRVLQRYKLRFGSPLGAAQVQQYSPDPDYAVKEAHLLDCLRQAATQADTTVLLFLDEMGYYRWPKTTPVWWDDTGSAAPVADRQQSKQQQWRLIGVLNALTGAVDYLDGYGVGRAKVIAMYQTIAQRYAWAERIYVVQDNWSIHRHPDVMTALQSLPSLEPVWLPTYAPWLNPIEKLWRWLRQHVLHIHQLAHDWLQLQHRVHAFLEQFADGSGQLLRYVGLAGNGKLASAIRLT